MGKKCTVPPRVQRFHCLECHSTEISLGKVGNTQSPIGGRKSRPPLRSRITFSPTATDPAPSKTSTEAADHLLLLIPCPLIREPTGAREPLPPIRAQISPPLPRPRPDPTGSLAPTQGLRCRSDRGARDPFFCWRLPCAVVVSLIKVVGRLLFGCRCSGRGDCDLLRAFVGLVRRCRRAAEMGVGGEKFQLGTVGALSLSVVSSVSIVICNKALMSSLGFNFGARSDYSLHTPRLLIHCMRARDS
jgi:hypothetical protein